MPLPSNEPSAIKGPKAQTVVLLISIGLFVVSLLFPAYCTVKHCQIAGEVLLIGWIGMLMGGAAISWLANPLLFVSWFLLAKGRKKAGIFSLAAVGFTASFLGFKTVLEDEAGHYNSILSAGPGYWLWLASGVAALAGSLLLLRKAAAD